MRSFGALIGLVVLHAACSSDTLGRTSGGNSGPAAVPGAGGTGTAVGVPAGGASSVGGGGAPTTGGVCGAVNAMAGTCSTAGSAGTASLGDFDVRSYLRRWTPGTAGEALPHGVPQAYEWAAKSIGGTPSRPRPETTHMNAWGELYVDVSNQRPANTRVAVKNTRLLALFPQQTEWQTLEVTDNIGGGPWTEDFSAPCPGTIDMKTEADGSRSLIPHPGCNAHFWPNLPFVPVPVVPLAVVSMAHVRLVLADAGAADDRDSSAYIIGVGADWRAADGSCPDNICTGVGSGRFIRAKKTWRAVLLSTLSMTEIDTLPMPAIEAFRLPDGSWPIE